MLSEENRNAVRNFPESVSEVLRIFHEIQNLTDKKDGLERMIKISFLSEAMKDKYTELIFEKIPENDWIEPSRSFKT